MNCLENGLRVQDLKKRLALLAKCTLCVSLLYVLVCATTILARPQVPDAGEGEGAKLELGDDARQMLQPSRIEGHQQCVDCHRAEYARWLKSKHAGRAFDLLRTADTSLKYAEELGIKASNIARDSVCISCHATPRHDSQSGHRVIAGVTCESCHNGSGGANGWLNVHAVYGPKGTPRELETAEHYQTRKQRCRAAGQFRSSDTYELARRCYECHIVGNEQLIEAGHPDGGGFDFATKSLGEVRHNYHLNQLQNAEVSTLWMDSKWHGEGRTAVGRKRLMFVVGWLADLDVSLRNLAKATDEEGDYLEAMADRITEAYEILEEINDDVGSVELTQALSAVEDIYVKIDDGEFKLDDRQACIVAAKQVALEGKKFADGNDGSGLTDVEEPETPEE